MGRITQVKIGLNAAELRDLTAWATKRGFDQPGKFATHIFRKRLDEAREAREFDPPTDAERADVDQEDWDAVAGLLKRKIAGETITDADYDLAAHSLGVDASDLRKLLGNSNEITTHA